MIEWTKASEELPKGPCLIYVHMPDDKYGRATMGIVHGGIWCEMPAWDDLPNEWVTHWCQINSPMEER